MTCTWSKETKICAERLIESETKTCAEIQIEGEIRVKVYLRLGKRSSYCDWCEVACVALISQQSCSIFAVYLRNYRGSVE